MSYKLSPTVTQLDGQLLECYERESRITEETARDLGLSTDEPIKSQMAIAPIEEFIMLQAENLATDDTVSWKLERIGQDVKIESLFIDSPKADSLSFQLFDGDKQIFNFQIDRNKTPYDFPDAPLSSNLRIQIKAKSKINLINIVLKPVIILDILSPDEPNKEREGR